MITILPETDGKTLVVQGSATITTRDYETLLIPELDRLIQHYGKIRVVFYFDETFAGWDFGAIWDDAKFGIKHRYDFERAALVSAPAWVGWAAKVSSHFCHCEIKTYPESDLAEAIAWTKA